MTTTETVSLLKKAEERIAELESQLEAWKATAEQFKVSWGNDREAMQQRLEASEKQREIYRQETHRWKEARAMDAQRLEASERGATALREALRKIKLFSLTTKFGTPAALGHICRLCIDAGVTEHYEELEALVGTKEGKLPVDNEGYMLRRAASGNMNQP